MVQRLATWEIPHGPIVKGFSRVADKSKVLLTFFLKLPPVKALQFALDGVLGMGRTVTPSQNNNGITPLPPIYTLRDDNLFRINLQDRYMKAIKEYDTEMYTAI